jgi:hypothetical protein
MPEAFSGILPFLFRIQEQAHVRRSTVLRHRHLHHQRRRPVLVWPALGWREDVFHVRACGSANESSKRRAQHAGLSRWARLISPQA